MIPVSEIHANLEKYGLKSADDVSIATICSHSALQIFAGARREDVRTIGICTPERRKVYEAFPYAKPNKFIEVKNFSDILKPEVQKKLMDEHAIVIPHGSFVEYVGAKNIEEKFEVPMLGNRAVLDWESDRNKQREWLEKKAGLHMPKIYQPDQIDKLCLVKLSGAKGGKNFFKVMSPKEYHREIDNKMLFGEIKPEELEGITIQEFIIGTRYYFHYFYSPICDCGYKVDDGCLELTGIDRRDETNADELQRLVGITSEKLNELHITPSYVVVGNHPIMLRESLLPQVFDMGKRVVDASIKLFKPGMLGPFCLEAICTPDLKFTTFEVSARIVAGTNLYINGSPYTQLAHGEHMSVGRRIAREIKNAIEHKQLDKIIH
jgi:5-formaminoimidazole-4-carboxamide-1-(beta)-D-ribofuranosyl 5'-monophosphate synthetase